MKKNKSNIIYILMLLVLASCAVTDIDKTADFYSYKTFSWGEANVNVKNPLHNSDLIDRNIKASIEKEFEKRGVASVKRNPDFLVSYKTFTEKKEQTSGGYHYGYPYMPLRFYPYAFRYGWGMPFGMYGSAPSTYSYTAGTLVIDVIDAKTKELIWRGSIEGNVNEAKIQKQVAKGVKVIMKKYPVSPEEPILPGESLQVEKKAIS